MRRSLRSTNSLTADQTNGSENPRDPDRHIVLAGVLLTTVVLAYFYAADRYFLSTRPMAPIFRYLLMRDDFNTARLMVGTCILAACWKNPRPMIRVVDALGAHVLAVVIGSVTLIAFAAVFVYHGNAFSMDEYAAVFQAKVFAAGRLTAQVPSSVVDWLIPPGFNGAFLIASRTTGRAIEAYWPGFSLLLAPFELFGVPWLCNACLAGCAVFLIHRVTLEITGERRAAGWAVAFTLASGAFVANAMSLYSMQAHLTANLLFTWLLMHPTPRRAFGAGVVGSIALVLHNPFPHALFAAPWIVALLRSETQRRSLLALVGGYLPLLLIVGIGWLRLRSVVTAASPGHALVNSGLSSAFSLPGKSMIDLRVAAMAKMWIWAVPCLFLFAAFGRLRRGDDPRVRLMTQSAVLTFAGYLFVVFDQGHGWGYRYFHPAWGVIPILAACGVTGSPGSTGRLAAFAGAAVALNLAVIVPWQMAQIDAIITRHSAQLPTPRRPGSDVYFVGAGGFYAADLVQMDPFLRSQDLILYSRGAALDAELRRQNWPSAALVDRGLGVEEWNLGPAEPRSAPGNGVSDRQFHVTFVDHAR